MMTIKKVREKYRNNYSDNSVDSKTIDFLILHKNNWRTRFKFESICSFCSSTDQLELHHIRPLKGIGNQKVYNRFDKLVASLNRKQICVCALCHRKITYGKYDGMALRDLIDVRLVAPEGQLKIHNVQAKYVKETQKNQNSIKIDEVNKTYYNPELAYYYATRNIYKDSSETDESL